MGKDNDTICFHNRGVTVNLESGNPVVEQVSVVLTQELHVPPCSEVEIMGAVPDVAAPGTWVVEPDKQNRSATLVARAIVNPGNGEVPIRLLNPRDEAVTVPKGRKIATWSCCPNSQRLHQCQVYKREQVCCPKQNNKLYTTLWRM